MSTMPLDPPLLDLFRNTTSSGDAPTVRVVLVQTNATGKSLSLVKSVPPRGSDKEDFEPLLGEIFAEEPTRSGYALYRLDSQAANGHWEWLCIAYQPDGAKVKEKMQYTMTRTSLLAGLNERHFLDTMYATSSGDFKFPAKLRNSRKHDYQNPQLKTAGKPASEAAGTDAGGAKRTFGARSAAAATTPSSSSSSAKATSTLEKEQESSDVAAAEDGHIRTEGNSKDSEDSTPLRPPQVVTASTNPKEDGASRSDAVQDTTHITQSGAPLSALAEKAPAQPESHTDEAGDSIAPSHQPNLPPGDPADANAARVDAYKETSMLQDEQTTEERKAPEEPPTRADEELSSPHLSKPQVPSPETAKKHLSDDVPIAKPLSEYRGESPAGGAGAKEGVTLTRAAQAADPAEARIEADERHHTDPRVAEPPSVSAIEPGAGADSEAIAVEQAPADESRTSPSAAKATRMKVQWSPEAEAALSGMSSRLSGSSEHNFVSITASEGTIDLRSPPRFVPPGDLNGIVEEELRESPGSHFALYRYPKEVETRKVAYLYTEPPQGSAQATWAQSIEEVQSKAKELIGCEVQREAIGAQYGPYPRPTAAQAEEIATRIQSILYRIESSTRESSRAKAPRLVAVSKLHPPSSIMAAFVHNGQAHFGENYVQELVDKAKVLPREIKWHFVGGLQSNKAKALAAIPNLYLLETLDSIKAANVLEKALAAPDAPQRDEPLRVYLQVNTSGEEAKSGLPPLLSTSQSSSSGDEEAPLFDLAKHVITSCPHLILQGLMTIGSASNSTAEESSKATRDRESALKANPDFGRLDESRTELVKRLRAADLQTSSSKHYTCLLDQNDQATTGSLELSMGMTNDFPIAISAGSDNVRIGTACFGQRPSSREEARRGMESELTSSGGGATGGDQAASTPAVSHGDKGFAKPKRPGQSRK